MGREVTLPIHERWRTEEVIRLLSTNLRSFRADWVRETEESVVFKYETVPRRSQDILAQAIGSGRIAVLTPDRRPRQLTICLRPSPLFILSGALPGIFIAVATIRARPLAVFLASGLGAVVGISLARIYFLFLADTFLRELDVSRYQEPPTSRGAEGAEPLETNGA